MKVIITARKFKAHDTLKDHIKSELSSLEKFNDQIIKADVVLSFQNMKDSIKIAEIILQVPGQTLTAKEESEEFSKSVSFAVTKLERQLRKLKTKRIAHI